MKNGIGKGWKGFFAGLCLCLLALALAPGLQSEAASKAPSCAKTQTVYIKRERKSDSYTTCIREIYEVGYTPSAYIYIKNLSADAKITNLKSSNKSLPAWSRVGGKNSLNAIALGGVGPDCNLKGKAGQKSKISFTVTQNGKKYKLSCTVTLKLQPSVFKSCKIGNKTYTSAMNKYTFVGAKKSGSKMKISFKMLSGYKIDKIIAIYGTDMDKEVTVKNNSKISTKNLSRLVVYYSVTKKPANYKKSSTWKGSQNSYLLDDAVVIDF